MEKEIREKDPQIDADTLARYLRTTENEIMALEKAGVLSSTGNGKNKRFYTAQAIREYCDHLRKRAKGYKDRKEEKDLEKLKEEVRYKEAKAELKEIELQILKGEAHTSEDVEYFINKLVFGIRPILTALPGRLAMDTAEETDEKKMSQIIDKEITQIRKSLREYSYCSADYQRRIKERNGSFLTEEGEVPDDEL